MSKPTIAALIEEVRVLAQARHPERAEVLGLLVNELREAFVAYATAPEPKAQTAVYEKLTAFEDLIDALDLRG